MKNHQEFDDRLQQIQKGLDISAQAQGNHVGSNETLNEHPIVDRIKKLGETMVSHYDTFESWLVNTVQGSDQAQRTAEPNTRTRLTVSQINQHTAKGESVVIFPFK